MKDDTRSPVNLTLHPEVAKIAESLRSFRYQRSLSALIETLIIEEWERRHGPRVFDENILKVAEEPIQYKIKKKGKSST